MGFGAIITLGGGNTPLDASVAGCITEVRVEQTLDAPAQFAVRFLDDIEDGRLRMANDTRLAIDTIVSIVVEVDDIPTCLVRGPITDHKSRMTLGGPGSWFEIQGLDSRDLLDRVCVQAAWTGRASDAARQVLGQAYSNSQVEETSRVYEEGRETLNQRSTDLEFLEQIARRNNLHLWVSYDTSRSALGGLQIEETAHLASSPTRPQGAAGVLASALSLVPNSALELRVHVPSSQCPNVTSFQVDVDSRRPSRYRTGSMARTDEDTQSTEASDPQPPAGTGAQRLDRLGGTQRELCMPGSGDPVDTQARGEAALTEAGWFVQATASTSSHLLGGVLKPHDVINAVGVGPRLGHATFRVKEVTHVINAAAHMMDLKLESNSLGDA